MLVSIVIRAHNEDRHIGRLMDGISRQELPCGDEVEVILVDSGSSDSTVAIAESMGARVVHIPKERFSFGRALNFGCSVASGEILLFASAHIYPVYSDWIENMLYHFKNPEVGIVYGRQIGNESTQYSEHQIFDQWFPAVSCLDQQTPFCNNANCAIRKHLWEENNYDELLTGLEDLAWAKIVKEKGLKIVYNADASIVHVHEESWIKIKRRYQREAIAMKAIFPDVHFSFFEFVHLLIVSTTSDILKATKSGVIFKKIFSICSFRFMQYYGTYLGHRQRGSISWELKNRFYYPSTISPKGELSKASNFRNGKRIDYSGSNGIN